MGKLPPVHATMGARFVFAHVIAGKKISAYKHTKHSQYNHCKNLLFHKKLQSSKVFKEYPLNHHKYKAKQLESQETCRA
jgi:hypothetical protein